MRITVASTYSITPAPSAMIWVRESRMSCPSIPVPTIGDSLRSSGTAWRIMFEPISARLASSCSRKGMRDAAIDAICMGATSISSIWSGAEIGKSASWRALILLRTNEPSSLRSALPCAIILPSSFSAVR